MLLPSSYCCLPGAGPQQAVVLRRVCLGWLAWPGALVGRPARCMRSLCLFSAAGSALHWRCTQQHSRQARCHQPRGRLGRHPNHGWRQKQHRGSRGVHLTSALLTASFIAPLPSCRCPSSRCCRRCCPSCSRAGPRSATAGQAVVRRCGAGCGGCSWLWCCGLTCIHKAPGRRVPCCVCMHADTQPLQACMFALSSGRDRAALSLTLGSPWLAPCGAG